MSDDLITGQHSPQDAPRKDAPRHDAPRNGAPRFWGGSAIRTVLVLAVLSLPAFARDNGQYQNVSPDIRQWFRDQKSPKTGMICCSEADGNEAQEDIRDGHYWATWPSVAPSWYQVPDEVVIRGPNKTGHPVIWTYYERGEVKIRCYAPGGKV